MIVKNILGSKKEFANKAEMIDYVKENIDQIIDFKRGMEQKSVDKGSDVSLKLMNGVKMFDAQDETKAIKTDDDHYFIAVNTTNILDSHDDVHDLKCWNKSVKDQNGKNYLVDSHVLSIDATIVKKEHINTMLVKVSFKELGFNYDGDCNVLIYKFRKDKVIDRKAKEWMESGDEIQASVRMRYVSMEFALNSELKEDSAFKKNYDGFINKIANRGDFEDIPYFFIVKEAINVRESSLVPFGSNHVTGNIIQEDNEPVITTQKKEPSEDTQLQTKGFSIYDFN